MRKIKKINGFLVVKFNDREKREYEGSAKQGNRPGVVSKDQGVPPRETAP